MSVKRTGSGIILTETPAIIKTSPTIPLGGLYTDLISYFNFDSGLNDIHASNNLTAFGSPSTVAGKISNAIRTDGIDDYLLCEDISKFDMGTGDLSVSIWVRWIDQFFNDVGLIGKKGSPAGGLGWTIDTYKIGTPNNGGIIAYANFLGGVNKGVAASSNILLDHLWHHIVLTFKRDGFMKIYNDNILASSVDISAHAVENIISLQPMSIGCLYIAAANYFGNNDYDEIGIWKKELSVVEISQLWNGGAGLPYASF